MTDYQVLQELKEIKEMISILQKQVQFLHSQIQEKYFYLFRPNYWENPIPGTIQDPIWPSLIITCDSSESVGC